MHDKGQEPSAVTGQDIVEMELWFSEHRTSAHHSARTLKEYVSLIRNALDNNDRPFLDNALRFFNCIGELGFQKVRSMQDLFALTTVVK